LIFALDKNGARIAASPGASGVCPACGTRLVTKCGSVVVWHWAHATSADCDPWSEPDSAWHRSWQDAVPPARRERIIGPHRADILAANGTIVELQHSYICQEEIAEREDFYGKMIWLFDATGCSDRLFVRELAGRPYVTFRWMHPKKTIAACRKPVCLDLGSGRILRVGRIYTAAPCGGWGNLATAAAFRSWMQRGTPITWGPGHARAAAAAGQLRRVIQVQPVGGLDYTRCYIAGRGPPAYDTRTDQERPGNDQHMVRDDPAVVRERIDGRKGTLRFPGRIYRPEDDRGC